MCLNCIIRVLLLLHLTSLPLFFALDVPRVAPAVPVPSVASESTFSHQSVLLLIY